jgi:hypothetical protein
MAFFVLLDMLRGEDRKKNEENRRQGQAPIKSDQNMIIQGAAHTVGGQAIQCKKKM